MPPQPPETTALGRRPRHAAQPDPRPSGPHLSAGELSGRHRRPESLADATRWRPTPARPSDHRRSAEERFVLGPYDEGFIERGFPAVTRAERRAAEAIARARQRQNERVETPAADGTEAGPDRHRQTGRRARSGRRADHAHRAGATRPGGARGRHAAPNDLAITVRPLPAVRDAVVDGLPAAKRAAGAVREWALATGERPIVGAHRAPGTLPIESWLLVGRARQQVLLATLVAAGLALVMVPLERHVDVNPIAAADRSVVSTAPGRQAHATTPATNGGSPAHQSSGDDADTSPARRPTADSPAVPPAGSETPPASERTEPPLPAVPPGTGPGHSLTVTGSDAVALTFDDGPDPVETPKILAMLDKYRIKATFCLVGENVQKHPEIVQQIVAAGHTLCNHTWDHSLVIGQEKPEQIRADLRRTTAAIEKAAPGAKVPFFRAPGGNFTDRLVSVAYGEGMTSLYWQVDPRDWDHTADADDAAHTDRVIAEVRQAVKPGSIVLSHDFNQPDTIAAYEKLLPYLTENFEIGMPVAPPIPADPSTASAEPPAAGAPADPADR